MIFTFLLVVQAIIAAALVTVILMQQSEGGGLGVGGSPSGLMSARGAANFLTRATTILATMFVSLSVVLAVIASVQHAPSSIDTSLAKTAPAAPANNAAPLAGGDPLAGAAQSVGNSATPATNESVPLAN
ncbi:preprotein translocase subunit SecG [Sphingobium sp. BS19]|nr:preprotein translocase subunit SecG [Sphingobium sp. BS19]